MGKITEYLEHARQCAELADKLTGADRAKLMAIAGAWLKLVDDSISSEAQPDTVPPPQYWKRKAN
jgi:hypothetical protein